ncbi:hypothetical protein ACFY5K_33175 [Streptomyces griseofuscus]|uniref:hypothetical protein n=1 Tax=Streptomyces griseofuscus TaxID=146922 RepID=UPI003400BE48
MLTGREALAVLFDLVDDELEFLHGDVVQPGGVGIPAQLSVTFVCPYLQCGCDQSSRLADAEAGKGATVVALMRPTGSAGMGAPLSALRQMELIQEIRSWMSSFMARPERALTVAGRWSWALVRLEGQSNGRSCRGLDP